MTSTPVLLAWGLALAAAAMAAFDVAAVAVVLLATLARRWPRR
jgi:hypothetical protein